MRKLKVKLQTKDNPYVVVNVKDKNGNPKKIYMHGYLVGIEAAIHLKKNKKWHSLVLLTGDVGDGKSSLTEGLAGLDATFGGKQLSLDNLSFSTEKLIEKTDREDNIEQPLWWDEAIQGASGRNMAITNLGNKLKIAFVTKRTKRNTYYLVIDEINEYSWKLIKMCDAWIHVKKIGLSRGYFNVYAHKSKIKFIYNAFKYYNKDWNSKEVRNVIPDCKGKFDDYSGLFIDQKEYDKMKIEETKQLEKPDTLQLKPEQVKALGMKLANPELSNTQIAVKLRVHRSTVNDWFKKIKDMSLESEVS